MSRTGTPCLYLSFCKVYLCFLLLFTILAGCKGSGNSSGESYGDTLTFSILYDGTPSQANIKDVNCTAMGIETITAKVSKINSSATWAYDIGCNQNGKITGLPLPNLSLYGLRLDGKDSSGVIMYSTYLNGFNSNRDLGPMILTYVGPERAKNVQHNSATLSSRFTNPNGATTTVWFEYGRNNIYSEGTTTPEAFAAAGQFTVTADISSLVSNTSYKYRLAMQSSSSITYRPAVSFMTLAEPEVVGTLPVLSRAGAKAINKAYDSNYVYYIENSMIKKAPISGGTVTTTLTAALNNPISLAVNSSAIYFLEGGGSPLNNDCTIKKAGLNGENITVLASGLYCPYAFTVDSSSIFILDRDGIKKMGINGGDFIFLSQGISCGTNFAIDTQNIYFFGDSSSIKKVSLNGGPVTTLTTGYAYQSWGQILVDSNYVYFVYDAGDIFNGSDFLPQGVKKISTSGGVVTTLINGGRTINGFDKDYVYVSDLFQSVVRLPK